jgi:hypothetical protein
MYQIIGRNSKKYKEKKTEKSQTSTTSQREFKENYSKVPVNDCITSAISRKSLKLKKKFILMMILMIVNIRCSNFSNLFLSICFNLNNYNDQIIRKVEIRAQILFYKLKIDIYQKIT